MKTIVYCFALIMLFLSSCKEKTEPVTDHVEYSWGDNDSLTFEPNDVGLGIGMKFVQKTGRIFEIWYKGKLFVPVEERDSLLASLKACTDSRAADTSKELKVVYEGYIHPSGNYRWEGGYWQEISSNPKQWGNQAQENSPAAQSERIADCYRKANPPEPMEGIDSHTLYYCDYDQFMIYVYHKNDLLHVWSVIEDKKTDKEMKLQALNTYREDWSVPKLTEAVRNKFLAKATTLYNKHK